jgi:hypothetical protein
MGDLWAKTFKEAFCERFNCPPEQYERRLFWRCLYRHALPLAALIHWLDTEFYRDVFREDFDFIREIGTVKDEDVFQVELDRFYGRNVRDKGWIRGTLLVRVSGKRLLKSKRHVFRA